MVVFFGITEAERDSIARNEGLEIDDVVDDFNYYTGRVAAYLNRENIRVDFTDKPVIVVKVGRSATRNIDRTKIPELMGMILTDGSHEPRVVPGVETDQELISEIESFFHMR